MRTTNLLLDLDPTFSNCIPTFGPPCYNTKIYGNSFIFNKFICVFFRVLIERLRNNNVVMLWYYYSSSKICLYGMFLALGLINTEPDILVSTVFTLYFLQSGLICLILFC